MRSCVNSARPVSRFDSLALGHPLAKVVHGAEVALGIGVTLLDENTEPSHRCGIVATFVRCHGFIKCLRRRDRRAGQRSQQRAVWNPCRKS